MKLAAFLSCATLMACGGSNLPSVSAPGLQKPLVVMQFNFPKGSTCQVSTSQGALQAPTTPGIVRFSLADKNRGAICRTPDGGRYQIHAAALIPASAKGVSAVTVSPSKGHITASINGALVRIEVDGAIRSLN